MSLMRRRSAIKKRKCLDNSDRDKRDSHAWKPK